MLACRPIDDFNRLLIHSQPGKLLPNMGNLLHLIILGHQDSGTVEELEFHGLTGLRTETMKTCKHIGDLSCKIPLPF